MEAKQSLEEQVVSKLKERGWHVAAAESCTGGLISGRLVNVAGVSEVFGEGYVTYSNEAKHRLLGVSEEALKDYGAVSSQVAEQMARGVMEAAGAQAAIAVTGIAGPDGGTAEKPVGLVYIGCCIQGEIVVTENHFKGSREEIRQNTVEAALKLLLNCISKG